MEASCDGVGFRDSGTSGLARSDLLGRLVSQEIPNIAPFWKRASQTEIDVKLLESPLLASPEIAPAGCGMLNNED